MPTSDTTSHSHGSLCPWWLGWTLNNSLRRLFHKPERILADLVLPGQRAADIGAGSGFFTLPLARYVGSSGRVYAVDIQPQMLRQIERHAARAGMNNIVTCQATADGFALPEPADFALVFWMLHEVPDCARLVTAMFAALAPGGRLLFSEPRFHVTASRFREETDLFTAAGFRVFATPAIRGSRSLLLEKPAA
jgi:ubiquinone/menaquinone biosynthesis C-methylase UbiE